MGEDLMAIDPTKSKLVQVVYQDETGYQWTSYFASQAEAMEQAVVETQTYGGTLPQEIVNDQGTTLVTQEEIIAAAE
jgi:hypothetical protein